MPVQLYLQLSDQIILSVQLQLQLINERVSLPELLDLQLQSELKVPQRAGALRHGHELLHEQTERTGEIQRRREITNMFELENVETGGYSDTHEHTKYERLQPTNINSLNVQDTDCSISRGRRFYCPRIPDLQYKEAEHNSSTYLYKICGSSVYSQSQ